MCVELGAGREGRRAAGRIDYCSWKGQGGSSGRNIIKTTNRHGGKRQRAIADRWREPAGAGGGVVIGRAGVGEGKILGLPSEVHQPEGRSHGGEGQACAPPLELHRR